ncbi:MAG: hypothetical protein HY720_26840 [Planctomycetes bacterium]|nr:hypothetical protein [Planctomycetota bacterium]
MPRQKKHSMVLRQADMRAAAMGSLGSTLDLGKNLSPEKYLAAIADLRAKLSSYNEILSHADAAKNAFHASERVVRDLSERMLAGVGATFGKDSVEYEKAGGVRKSEHKRPSRRKADVA